MSPKFPRIRTIKCFYTELSRASRPEPVCAPGRKFGLTYLPSYQQIVIYSGMSSSPSSRLWVGPLLLILVIALIYIFSLMPNSPPQRELAPLIDDTHHVRTFRLGDHEITESIDELKVEVPPELLSSSCLNGGFLNETDGACICLHLYTGTHCEKPVNASALDVSSAKPATWCVLKVKSSMDGVDAEKGYVGKYVPGNQNSRKPSFPSGYMGMSCATCDPTSGRECEIPSKRRGAVNSRLTLSGLSFCMITIGLLCVTARRRRAGPLPPSEDTWYRVFQPAQSRAARCRHDLMCGGSWMPRDRALLVAPGRAAVVHGSSRSSSRGRRLATPPPSYTSVDNLADEQLPPSYEEATRILENSPTSAALIQELIDETVQTVEAKEDSPEVAEASTNTTTTAETQTTQEDENANTTTLSSSI
ncbi:hypothetical protein ANCCEY_03795 [Ancylostoma ceylanicum]|uniref:EGF-like domain-containing protein n=1 Tax=Ancylostoma ceylanicum TaxID=53326 RepID=A0A0D6LZ20_9BILA|nr:hypothetical protein ANCCEY_03795 [Ancylostoma ceylanicum]